MFCRECGGKAIVVESREYDNEVFRKRKCTKCGRMFFTMECEDDEYNDGKQGIYLFHKEWRANHKK